MPARKPLPADAKVNSSALRYLASKSKSHGYSKLAESADRDTTPLVSPSTEQRDSLQGHEEGMKKGKKTLQDKVGGICAVQYQ